MLLSSLKKTSSRKSWWYVITPEAVLIKLILSTWFFHIPSTFDTKGKFHRQVFCRIAALNSFLENYQVGLHMYRKRNPLLIFYWEISKNFCRILPKNNSFVRKNIMTYGALTLTYFAVSFTSLFLDVISFLWNK